MKTPHCIGVWKPSLQAAIKFVSDNRLGDNIIQFAPDDLVKGGHWAILRVTRDECNAIVASPNTTKVI